MSRASMIEAASTLPRSPLYGVASCWVGSEHRDFEIGWAEFERDADWVESLLRSADVRSGDLALTTIQTWETPWIGPVIRALHRIGVTFLPAEQYDWDARRTAMFLQRLPVRFIFGLCGATLGGLEAQQLSIAELLRDVDVVWARLDALGKLSGVGPEVLPMTPLGPALAVGLPGQPGVVVNAAEWTVDSADGELVVSTAGERTAKFDRIATGIRGSVRSVADGTITLDLELPA